MLKSVFKLSYQTHPLRYWIAKSEIEGLKLMEEKRGYWEKLTLQMGLESEVRWDFSLEFKRGEIDQLGFHEQERLKI